MTELNTYRVKITSNLGLGLVRLNYPWSQPTPRLGPEQSVVCQHVLKISITTKIT